MAALSQNEGKTEMESKKLMVSESGDLVALDDFRVIREKYSYHFREIKNVRQFHSSLRAGKYAWPGGYELFFCIAGDSICWDWVKENLNRERENVRQYSAVLCGSHETEPEQFFCCDCNKDLSAYTEED